MKTEYNSPNTSIAVIGGGNIGTQFACICASKGYRVNLFTSKPELFDGTLEAVDEFGDIITGNLNVITNDLKTAMEGCRLIFVTHPSFQFKKISDAMCPHISSGTKICVIPGTGGAEFSFQKCIRAGAELFGLQRVPSVARLEQYGKRVRCEGLRNKLFLAGISTKSLKEMSKLLSSLWGGLYVFHSLII